MRKITPVDQSTILEEGTLDLQGQFLLGSNYTFLVKVRHSGQEYPAVYKPQKGEQPLWDFPENSLARREVAAYLVSRALGWGLVPITVLRDGPFGPGSLQQYIDYDPDYHFFNFTQTDRERLQPVVLFDLLVNNADRKGSHVFFEKGSHRLFAIDHGLCFHVEDKLRTVLWDFAGKPFPADLLEDLVNIQPKLREGGSLHAALSVCLEMVELEALEARLRKLVDKPEYPFQPKDRRALPYPPL